MNPGEWMAWTFMLGDKAYHQVRPLTIEIREQLQEHTEGWLWWEKNWATPTGQWEIKFTHDTGPLSSKRTDIIVFKDEKTARYWYEQTYTGVFLGKPGTSISPPPVDKPKKPKKPSLTLV